MWKTCNRACLVQTTSLLALAFERNKNNSKESTLAMLATTVKKWNLLYKLRNYKYKSLGVQKELREIRAKMCLATKL